MWDVMLLCLCQARDVRGMSTWCLHTYIYYSCIPSASFHIAFSKTPNFSLFRSLSTSSSNSPYFYPSEIGQKTQDAPGTVLQHGPGAVSSSPSPCTATCVDSPSVALTSAAHVSTTGTTGLRICCSATSPHGLQLHSSRLWWLHQRPYRPDGLSSWQDGNQCWSGIHGAERVLYHTSPIIYLC